MFPVAVAHFVLPVRQPVALQVALLVHLHLCAGIYINSSVSSCMVNAPDDVDYSAPPPPFERPQLVKDQVTKVTPSLLLHSVGDNSSE